MPGKDDAQARRSVDPGRMVKSGSRSPRERRSLRTVPPGQMGGQEPLEKIQTATFTISSKTKHSMRRLLNG